LAEIQRHEAALETLKSDLDRSPHRVEIDRAELGKLKQEMVERMGKFRELMQDRRNTPLARQALRKLLVGPIKCVPVEIAGRKEYAIRGDNKAWRFVISR